MPEWHLVELADRHASNLRSPDKESSMHPIRRHFLASASISLLAPFLPGCAQSQREEYKPVVGQAGKDVIWVPTPDAVVQRMLDMAELKPGEKVVDLGSGDGKIAIAAARRGAIARGIEYNPDMVAVSRRNAQAAGVKVDFQQGDIFRPTSGTPTSSRCTSCPA
jgi:2-polyprenyl-3-methyl-5-hydroxy-6-metoxy-1,4-benzoquinol methylase